MPTLPSVDDNLRQIREAGLPDPLDMWVWFGPRESSGCNLRVLMEPKYVRILQYTQELFSNGDRYIFVEMEFHDSRHLKYKIEYGVDRNLKVTPTKMLEHHYTLEDWDVHAHIKEAWPNRQFTYYDGNGWVISSSDPRYTTVLFPPSALWGTVSFFSGEFLCNCGAFPRCRHVENLIESGEDVNIWMEHFSGDTMLLTVPIAKGLTQVEVVLTAVEGTPYLHCRHGELSIVMTAGESLSSMVKVIRRHYESSEVWSRTRWFVDRRMPPKCSNRHHTSNDTKRNASLHNDSTLTVWDIAFAQTWAAVFHDCCWSCAIERLAANSGANVPKL